MFDEPIPDKAAAEKALIVTTVPAVEGAWRWKSAKEVHWRPKEYWKPDTQVTLAAELNGIDSGSGGWFVRDYTTNFTIGKNQLVEVDHDNHPLKLVRDGRGIKDVPMSAGTSRYMRGNARTDRSSSG